MLSRLTHGNNAIMITFAPPSRLILRVSLITPMRETLRARRTINFRGSDNSTRTNYSANYLAVNHKFIMLITRERESTYV